MPSKKRTTKKSAAKKVIRKTIPSRKLKLSGEVTARTWVLFVIFLFVSVFVLNRLSQGY